MFKWFFNLFVTKKNREDLFHPRERAIYTYWNGKDFTVVDPLPLYKKVMAKGPELSVDIKVSMSPSKDSTKAHGRLIESLREIFNIKPFEEGGLTEAECQALLEHFMDFTANIKKNSSNSQTSRETTSPGTVPSQEESQPISNGSDSGSTEPDNTTDPPPQSL